MQKQLPRLSCHLLLPVHCFHTSNLSILHVNRHAKGRAIDTADTESFSYTRTTTALLAWLSLTRCSYSPFPHPSLARDLQPDILHQQRSVLSWPKPILAFFNLCYLPLKWGKNDNFFLFLIWSCVVHINKGSWVCLPLSQLQFEAILRPSYFEDDTKSTVSWNIKTKQQIIL